MILYKVKIIYGFINILNLSRAIFKQTNYNKRIIISSLYLAIIITFLN